MSTKSTHSTTKQVSELHSNSYEKTDKNWATTPPRFTNQLRFL